MGRKKDRIYDRKTCQVFRLIPHTEQANTEASNCGQSVATSTIFGSDQEKFATQAAYGIDYQDDYDYMQHLRESGKHIVELQPIAMANKLPKKVIQESEMTGYSEDPEIMCELLDPDQIDEDVDALLESDAELGDDSSFEDDFVVKADAVIVPHDNSFAYFRSTKETKGTKDKVHFNVSRFDEDYESDDEEQFQSKSTLKELRGCALKRKLPEDLEHHFNKFLQDYDDDASSDDYSLDDEIHDEDKSSTIIECAQEWKNKLKQTKIQLEKDVNDRTDHLQITKLLATRMQCQDDCSYMDKLYIDDDTKEKWDCESILTTATNLYNHPTTITEVPRFVKLNKHGIPIGQNSSTRFSEKMRRLNAVNELTGMEVTSDEDDKSMLTARTKASTYRSPTETKEERRARKKCIKAERKERREEKKVNKFAFKQEFLRHHQNKIANPQKGIVLV